LMLRVRNDDFWRRFGMASSFGQGLSRPLGRII